MTKQSRILFIPLLTFLGAAAAHAAGVCPAPLNLNIVKGRLEQTAPGKYSQRITIQNRTTTLTRGPLYLILDRLSEGATVANGQGFTDCGRSHIKMPLRRVYLGGNAYLEPGASVNMTVDFTSGNGLVDYDPSLVIGPLAGHGGPVWGDYDGDGKADQAAFDHDYLHSHLQVKMSATGDTVDCYVDSEWQDIPVVGDFDGDGKSDPATYRYDTGEFRYGNCGKPVFLPAVSLNTPKQAMPVPGDYDGDGLTDPAVFIVANAQWKMIRSSAGALTLTWGVPGDLPVPGDYDGDGITDLAVYRPSTSQWLILGSSAGSYNFVWGFFSETNLLIPGDFDGDGKADAAFFRRSDRTWYIALSSGGTRIFQHGSEDPTLSVPVPADYDGDGKTDLADRYPYYYGFALVEYIRSFDNKVEQIESYVVYGPPAFQPITAYTTYW